MRTKDEVHRLAWARLREAGAARFPFPIEGRIPSFVGAEAAAGRLASLPFYRRARRLKCNPDSPQLPVRRRALADGKVVFMAVPRLRQERCFLELDPSRLGSRRLARAASIAGAARLGRPAHPLAMPAIDLVVAGSVAVTPDGARLGTGGGCSDLEFAIGRELGLITSRTIVVTTVHDAQLIEEAWPVSPHDVPVDWIVTPTRAIACRGGHPRRGWYDAGVSDLEKRASEALERIDGIGAAVLFGSRATGRARPSSDLDVAVLPHAGWRGSRLPLLKRCLVALADLAPDGRVDVVFIDEAPALLRQRIFESGHLLLCRDPVRWRDWRVRTMREHGDREQIRRLMREAQRRRLEGGVASGRSGRALRSLERTGKLPH